jgi:Flp pilus assembly protein TadD
MLKALIVTLGLLAACQAKTAVAAEAKYWHMLGLDALKERHFEVATSHFEHAAKADPTWAQPQRMLGIAYGHLGKPELANTHYARYLALAPDAADAARVRDIIAASMPVASR